MTERRIDTEGLPPLPDDGDAAVAAKQAAQQRLSEVRRDSSWLEAAIRDIRDMRLHNGFGPRLEEAYELRKR